MEDADLQLTPREPDGGDSGAHGRDEQDPETIAMPPGQNGMLRPLCFCVCRCVCVETVLSPLCCGAVCGLRSKMVPITCDPM